MLCRSAVAAAAARRAGAAAGAGVRGVHVAPTDPAYTGQGQETPGLKGYPRQGGGAEFISRENLVFGVGRGKNANLVATVFGATGCIGAAVAEQCARAGYMCYFPYRGDEMEMRFLKPMFDLGMQAPMPFHGNDEDSIRRAVQNSDVVINCIGKNYETKHAVPTRRKDGSLSRVNFDFEDVNVNIPQRIARICAEEGVEQLIHFSSLSASPDSISECARTKALGEQAVTSEFPEAYIVRPAPVFGKRDKLLNFYLYQQIGAPFVALVDGGTARVQPTYVGDVAEAVLKLIKYPSRSRRVVELAGPDEYSQREIAEFVWDVTQKSPMVLDLPTPLARLYGKLTDLLPGAFIHEDDLVARSEDILLDPETRAITYDDLEISPTLMENMGFNLLRSWRPGSHFQYVEGYHTTVE